MNANQIKSAHMREQFVKYYLMGETIKDAAIKAGYSPKTASTQGSLLLQMPEILKMIEDERAKVSEKMSVTKDELVKDLLEIKNRTKYKSPTIAIKCVEVINKMYGYNESDKSTVTVKTEAPIFGPLSDDDISDSLKEIRDWKKKDE